jgi:hypothetical protein
VDNTFVIWPHGQDKQREFLDYLNGLHNNIKFTMEIEEEGHLPFLDIDTYRKTNGSIGHKVYRKPTHTNPYLHHRSHHHPANKQSVLSSLIHRARSLCDQESLAQELQFLATVFENNGYSPQHIRRAINQEKRATKPKEKFTATAYIPYTTTTYNRLSRMLAKLNINLMARPPRKISSYLPPVKDELGLKTPGIYRIPCECGKVYIGQRSVRAPPC